jgi:hypothetical protein
MHNIFENVQLEFTFNRMKKIMKLKVVDGYAI